MATAVQVQYRRDSAANVAAFTGAAGEMVIDTTNNRVVVQDGATAGGFPAAKLSEVVTNTRTQVSDGNYTALDTDRTIAYITLTASRVISLPTAASYPTGSRLLIVDESGNCSSTKTLTLDVNGSDLIDGAASAVINSAYGYLAIESNGANKWTIVDQLGSTLNGLQGVLTIAANDGDVVTASGSTVTLGGPGGLVNKFRNATMDVWQRGTSGTVTTSGGYTADGWIVLPTGASVTWAQAGGRLVTKNSLQVTGANSVTGLIIKQRIESLIAAAFCSQTVTVEAQVYNGTGGSITPTLSVNRATGQDNGTYTDVDVNAVSLQSCPASAWTLVSYTFAANANSYNGLEIVFNFGNNFGADTKTVQITECDIRVTPGAPTGLNSNPPPPELRPIAIELPLCMRYFQLFGLQASYFTGIAFQVSSTEAYLVFQFSAPMRATGQTASLSSSAAVSASFAGADYSLTYSSANLNMNSGLLVFSGSSLPSGGVGFGYISSASNYVSISSEL